MKINCIPTPILITQNLYYDLTKGCQGAAKMGRVWVRFSQHLRVETFFTDRAFSCIFVHRAAETIFADGTFSDIFGHADAPSSPTSDITARRAPPAHDRTSSTNTGRAARQGAPARNIFRPILI
jgi:hypothetical protein